MSERDARGMTEEERARLLAHINTKCRGLTCPACRHLSFEFIGLVAPGIWSATTGLAFDAGRATPMAQVACRNCALVLSFLYLPIQRGDV